MYQSDPILKNPFRNQRIELKNSSLRFFGTAIATYEAEAERKERKERKADVKDLVQIRLPDDTLLILTSEEFQKSKKRNYTVIENRKLEKLSILLKPIKVLEMIHD